MKDSRPISISPYFDIVYRHRRGALGVFAVGFFATLFTVVVLPDVYKSTAVIAIEPAQVAADYINLGTGSSRETGNVADQLGALAHEAFSKERLIQLIKTYKLYHYHPGGSLDTILPLMERHIDLVVPQDAITYESAHTQSGQPDILKISFEYRDRDIAQKITASLADSYIEEGYRQRVQRADDAAKFLSAQVAQERSKLDAKGAEIKNLEQRYQGSLPQELEANLGEIARLENQLSMINQQISIERALPMAYGQAVAASPEQELKRLEIELSQLRGQYSDQYPDVIQLRQQIAELKQQIKDSPSSSDTTGDVDPTSGRLEREATAIEGQIAAIKTRVAATPVHGQELAALQRDYDNLASEYSSLLSKQLAAQLNEGLVKRHQDGRLRLLEPANLPHKPIRPNRPALLIVGVLVSAIGALSLPFGLYFTDTSFKDADELTREFGIPVVSTIPSIESPTERRMVIIRTCAASSAGIILSAAAIWAYATNLF